MAVTPPVKDRLSPVLGRPPTPGLRPPPASITGLSPPVNDRLTRPQETPYQVHVGRGMRPFDDKSADTGTPSRAAEYGWRAPVVMGRAGRPLRRPGSGEPAPIVRHGVVLGVRGLGGSPSQRRCVPVPGPVEVPGSGPREGRDRSRWGPPPTPDCGLTTLRWKHSPTRQTPSFKRQAVEEAPDGDRAEG